MNFNDKVDKNLKGIFSVKTVDAITGEVLDDSGEDQNVIVLDSREAVTRAISTTSADNVISQLKLGDDIGDFMTGTPLIIFGVGAPDTLIRTTGTWAADGFTIGDEITISNSVSNDGIYLVSGVYETILTLTGSLLVTEAPSSTILISRGSVDVPQTALVSYDETTMDVIYTVPTALVVGYDDLQSVRFSTTIIGSAVMALYPAETSKLFTSAALHTGDGNVFAYKRFAKKSISALVNLVISWKITY